MPWFRPLVREADGNEFLRGRAFQWSYDGIGNRLTSAAGGDTNGQNLRVSSYAPNALNQYAAIQNPGAADVIGVADDPAAVTINNSAASQSPQYDADGNLTSDGIHGYSWDGEKPAHPKRNHARLSNRSGKIRLP